MSGWIILALVELWDSNSNAPFRKCPWTTGVLSYHLIAFSSYLFTVIQSILAIDHHACFSSWFLKFYYLVYFYSSMWWETPDNQDCDKVCKATCKWVGAEDFESTFWKIFMIFRHVIFTLFLSLRKPFVNLCGAHCVPQSWGHEIREIAHSHLHWLQIEMPLSFPWMSPQRWNAVSTSLHILMCFIHSFHILSTQQNPCLQVQYNAATLVTS